MEDLIVYINANRVRYTREAISDQLVAAGHDRKLIAEAWAASDAAAQAAAVAEANRPRYGWFTLGLIVVGAIVVAIAGGESGYGGLVAVVYVVGALICTGGRI